MESLLELALIFDQIKGKGIQPENDETEMPDNNFTNLTVKFKLKKKLIYGSKLQTALFAPFKMLHRKKR